MHNFIKTDKQILESEIDMTMDRRIKRNTLKMLPHMDDGVNAM